MDWNKPVVLRPVSPAEKFSHQRALMQRFQSAGLSVYLHIDGHRTPTQILRETRIDEATLVEILTYMEQMKIIEPLSTVQESTTKPATSPVPPSTKPELRSTESQPQTGKPTVKTYPPGLTLVEKKIYDTYGMQGVTVFRAIDGEKTIEDIIKSTGVEEQTLMEMLNYFNKQGFIQIEQETTSPPPASVRETRKEALKTPEAAPQLSSSQRAPQVQVEDTVKPLRKVALKKIGVLELTSLKFSLKKYPNAGAVIDYLASVPEADEVDIVKATFTPIDAVSNIIDELIAKALVLHETVTKENIRHKYGPEGLAIYLQYGREGVLLYELIDKAKSFKEIVDLLCLPPERTIDIFLYIHNLLNVDLPVSREMLVRQLKQEVLR